MSLVTKWWIFSLLMFGLFFSFVWKATEDPKYLFAAFGVFLIQGIFSLQFRCPRCRNPITKRRTTSHRFGYLWSPPLVPLVHKMWNATIAFEQSSPLPALRTYLT